MCSADVGGALCALCAPSIGAQNGQGREPRLAPKGSGGGKFPPVTKPYDKLTGRAVGAEETGAD